MESDKESRRTRPVVEIDQDLGKETYGMQR